MQDTYILEKQTQIEDHITKCKAISSRYSMIRLVFIILIGFSMYQIYYQHSDLFYILLLVSMVCFIYFVYKHRKLREQLELFQLYQETYQDIQARKLGDWKEFKEQGNIFLNETNTQAYDLDVFGKASLYQYLCVAKTTLGKKRLAALLTTQRQEREEIIKRQHCIKELYEQTDFNIQATSYLKRFEKHAKKKKQETWDTFFQYMETGTKSSFMKSVLPVICTCVFLCICLLTLVFKLPYAVIMIFVTLQVIFALICFMKHSAIFHSVGIMEHMMSDYEQIFYLIQQTTFKSDELNSLQAMMQDAYPAIKKLHRIMSFIQLRNDGILFMILNGLFMIDFHCANALNHWQIQYGTQVRIWMQALADFESCLSLSQLGLAKEHISFPTICETDEPYIKALHLHHPLICEDNAIANDITLENGTIVITGSNMSGKTTFLRTIGLNMILFHAGAMVCANDFHANSMQIYTSMRVHDNVNEGISTFYAEILRIKEMILHSKKQQPMLVLIDEIFKGTNSADRIICAKEVLKQLHLPWIIAMVSTHDFELCELQFDKAVKAVNYHFNETYIDQKIQFDYILKEGRCTTTNAQALLKMAGISFSPGR